MPVGKVFSGRVVFDHLAKTGGQAINAWLMQELGAGNVTPNLIGDHRDLLRRYGGLYSVISGHMQFQGGGGLDPRYRYMTILREPVERAVSLLYFLRGQPDDSDPSVIEMKHAAKRTIDSEGRDIPAALVGSISNMYVEHFCRVAGSGSESDEKRVSNALDAIGEYDVVGLHSAMPQFLADAANLIGLVPPSEIAKVNVTPDRPRVEQISRALRKKLAELNEQDLRFYSEIAARQAARAQADPGRPPALLESQWKKYEQVLERVVTTPDFAVLSASLRQGKAIRYGQVMSFDVNIFLANDVGELEMGIHIFDGERQWAFGTNSTLLGQSPQSVERGAYRVTHHVVANLAAGPYSAGFAFNEVLPGGVRRELAWHDAMCPFEVHNEEARPFVGHSYLPADMRLSLAHVSADHRFTGDDARLHSAVGRRAEGCLATTGQAGALVYGPYIPLPAGRYVILVRGSIGERGLAGAYADLAVNGGGRVIEVHDLVEPEEGDCLLALAVTLSESLRDAEVRVMVTDQSDLKISAIEIARRNFE